MLRNKSSLIDILNACESIAKLLKIKTKKISKTMK